MPLLSAPLSFFRLLAGAGLLLAGLAGPARAQTASPAFSLAGVGRYQGPRYPGGPDSLRAYVARQLRGANPAWVGEVFVQLDFDSLGYVRRATYLVPPVGTPAATLVRNVEVQTLVGRAVQQMPRWQRDHAAPTPPAGPTVAAVLRFPFGAVGSQPLAYADEFPVFAGAAGRSARGSGRPVGSVRHLLQVEFRYPKADLKAQTQGTVYGYFEVSETGVVENRRVVGSLSPTIDAELLRGLALLPTTSTPPRQQGRPARVYYVVPVVLKLETMPADR